MFVLIAIGIGIALFLTWLFGIIAVAQSDHLSNKGKLAGVLGMFFFPVIGTAVYYFIFKPKWEMRRIESDNYIVM
ncbi:MAG: hypothetical protein AB8G22_25255 [Saprospiraceae bacterium]